MPLPACRAVLFFYIEVFLVCFYNYHRKRNSLAVPFGNIDVKKVQALFSFSEGVNTTLAALEMV